MIPPLKEEGWGEGARAEGRKQKGCVYLYEKRVSIGKAAGPGGNPPKYQKPPRVEKSYTLLYSSSFYLCGACL